MRWAILSLMFSTSALGAPPVDPVDIQIAVGRNDVEELRKLGEVRGFAGLEWGIVDVAVANGTGGCRDEALAVAVELGAKLAPYATKLREARCEKTLAAIAAKMTDAELELELRRSVDWFLAHARHVVDVEPFGLLVVPFTQEAFRRCDAEKRVCAASNEVEGEIEAFFRTREEDAAAAAVPGADIAAQICRAEAEKKSAQADLAEERAIGRTSGAVSLTRLRSAGADIVGADKELARLRKAFKARTGKPFKSGEWSCDR